MSPMPSQRLHRIHQELGDIVDDLNIAGRLPHVLLARLKAVRGMLLEEMNASRHPDFRQRCG